MRKSGIQIWLTKAPNSPYWQVRWIDPETDRPRQRSTGTTSKKEADRFLGKLEAEIAERGYQPNTRIRWKDFRQRYEVEYVDELAGRTAQKISTVLDAVEKHLKPTFLRSLTPSNLSILKERLKKEDESRSSETVNGYLRHLNAALGWAEEMDMIPPRKRPPRGRRGRRRKGRRTQIPSMRGRPITQEEFERMLDKIESVVGEKSAPSWKHFLMGLWWSGLRLKESLLLTWDDDLKLRVNLDWQRPMLSIPNEHDKGNKDHLLPMAPEFAKFLLETPMAERRGSVFHPRGKRRKGIVGPDHAGGVISEIGEAANVKVNDGIAGGKPKFASAHDLRRAFGSRWAGMVMPAVLMELMRHQSITTTLKYYVGRNAERTADQAWEAYEQAEDRRGSTKTKKRDTSRDTSTKVAFDAAR